MTQPAPKAATNALDHEAEMLEDLYPAYTDEGGAQMQVMRELTLKAFAPFLRGGRALELGCSDGFMTKAFADRFDHLQVIDGAHSSVEAARALGRDNIVASHSLFEQAEVEAGTFDAVFAVYILEHVLDPGPILSLAKRALKPEGQLFVVVPNARALSRQLAHAMGLVDDLYALTPNDLKSGHRRVYDALTLNRDLRAGGFGIAKAGGLFVKLLADFQLNELYDQDILTSDHIEGLYRLGEQYPDLCGSLFAVATPDKG